MSVPRRSFLRLLGWGAAGAGVAGPAAVAGGFPSPSASASLRGKDDPWLEVSAPALRSNAAEVARIARGRPVLAVIKNNAYGLGLERVGRVLDRVPQVAGLAVVKVEEAIRLREAGTRKPVLLMTRARDAEARELVRLGVRLALFHDDDGERIQALARDLQRPVRVHLYLDTGMGRLGMPVHRALPWLEDLAARPEISVEGTFMGFTEDRDFDREQLRRFVDLAATARERGLPLGRLHAASSHAVTFFPEAHLDMVRPGLMLFGAHVSGGREAGAADLTPAFRLRARVIRVERLRAGDTVSYGRNYEARTPVWVATIPVGHADGYPRQAVEGCRVLVGDRTVPVIGAVSASHTIVEVGPERTVEVGDAVTLVGPDVPGIHPNEVSERTGRSVYDVLMHLSPTLPVREWGGPDE